MTLLARAGKCGRLGAFGLSSWGAEAASSSSKLAIAKAPNPPPSRLRKSRLDWGGGASCIEDLVHIKKFVQVKQHQAKSGRCAAPLLLVLRGGKEHRQRLLLFRRRDLAAERPPPAALDPDGRVPAFRH